MKVRQRVGAQGSKILAHTCDWRSETLPEPNLYLGWAANSTALEFLESLQCSMLAQKALTPNDIHSLNASTSKADETNLIASRKYDWDFNTYSGPNSPAMESLLSTKSDYIFTRRRHGVAESAALFGAKLAGWFRNPNWF